jgi:hypothetical protein
MARVSGMPSPPRSDHRTIPATEYGQLEVQVTIKDPKAYTATFPLYGFLAPSTALLDGVCLGINANAHQLIGRLTCKRQSPGARQ